jgi:hypothetical protein
MWVRNISNRQDLDVFSDLGQLVALQFILVQALPGHIHRPGSVCLRHLGEGGGNR